MPVAQAAVVETQCRKRLNKQKLQVIKGVSFWKADPFYLNAMRFIAAQSESFLVQRQL